MALGDEPPQAQALDRRQGGEAQQVGDSVEVVHLAVDEEPGTDRRKPQLVLETELSGKPDHVGVRRRQDVVEAVDRMAAEVHRRREAPEGGGRFEQRDSQPGLGKAQGQHRAQDASADDRDGALAAHASRPAWAGTGRGVVSAGKAATGAGRDSKRWRLPSASGEIGGWLDAAAR